MALAPGYTLRLARPDENDACLALEDAVWAPFHGGIDGDCFLGYRYPELHLVVEAPSGEIVATGEAAPFDWDGDPDHLPAQGWQQVSRRARDPFETKPRFACALGITVKAGERGHGVGGALIDGLLAAAKAAGYEALAAPVRPTQKWRLPLLDASAYSQLRLPDGRLFDPWLRLHEAAGGVQIGVCERSLEIIAPHANWESWSGLKLPWDGSLLIDGAVGVLKLGGGLGRLREPSIWYLHA